MNLLKTVNIKKIAPLVGAVLMLFSLVFVARRLMLMWHDIDFSILANPLILAALLLVALMEGIGIIMASQNFRALVANVSGLTVERPTATMVYATANIYKYIPGGVMLVLGRNRMAIETEGLGHGKVFAATILEGALAATAAIMLSMLYAFEYVIYYFRQLNMLPLLALLLGLVMLIVVPLLYCFRHHLPRLLNKLKKDNKDFRLAVLIKRLAVALGLMVLMSGAFLTTLIILGQPMTFGLGITVMGLFILSWLAGFLTPGAPGGLGVREVVLLMFLSGTLNENILLSAVVLHRLLAIMGDAAAYGMAFAYNKIMSAALLKS